MHNQMGRNKYRIEQGKRFNAGRNLSASENKVVKDEMLFGSGG
jgi:hypothetical protein